MKILFTTNILSFYRVDFFNELGKSCDLTVAYEKENVKDRSDSFYKKDNRNYTLKKIKFSYKELKSLIQENYDIIIIGTYATKISALLIMMLKFYKINFILNADGGFVTENTPIQNMIKKFFISKASYYLSSGLETNKYLTYYGADDSKIFCYPFTSLFEKDIKRKVLNSDEKNKVRKKYKLPIDKKIFISIGRFYYIKGNDIIINNVLKNEYKNCEFYLISGGELKANYEDIIKRNNIKNIHLIDYLNREDLYSYISACDCMLMPTRGDVWGLVINEAMAVGCPIIASNKCIAALELLDEKYIFDINNQQELTNLIYTFINMSEQEKEKIGLDNIKKIKKYTIENMAKEHLKIFRKIKNYEKN